MICVGNDVLKSDEGHADVHPPSSRDNHAITPTNYPSSTDDEIDSYAVHSETDEDAAVPVKTLAQDPEVCIPAVRNHNAVPDQIYILH